jgi:hypothetical protein
MVGRMKTGQHTCIGWRVLASQPLKCVCRLVTAFFLLGIPFFSANAETAPSRSVQYRELVQAFAQRESRLAVHTINRAPMS